MRYGPPTPEARVARGARRPAGRTAAVRAGVAVLCAVGASVLVSGAQAQPAAGRPEPSRAAYRDVTRSCAPEVQRFCPELLDNPSQPRNWAICLKPYRASLSFGCRRAVRGVFPQG